MYKQGGNVINKKLKQEWSEDTALRDSIDNVIDRWKPCSNFNTLWPIITFTTNTKRL